MKRNVLLGLLCIMFCITLSSCYDVSEIDDMAYVLALGIDKGVSHQWRLTVQLPTMDAAPGGGGIGGEGDKKDGASRDVIITIDAPSFFTGINMINVVVPRELNFMHTKYIVVSEELARSGMLGEMIAPLVRYRQVRKSTYVIIAKGSAMEFIRENKPTVGATLSKSMEIMMDEWENTAFFPPATLHDLYNGFKSTYRQPVAMLAAINDFSSFIEGNKGQDNNISHEFEYTAGQLPRIGGSRIEFMGSAIFDGDKMVGELTGSETRIMMIGRGELVRGFFTIPDPYKPEMPIPLDVRMARTPEVKVRVEGD